MNPSDVQFKSLVKEAILELIQEQREEVKSLLADVFEDAGLVRAIEEGLKTPSVDRDEMLSWLNDRA